MINHALLLSMLLTAALTVGGCSKKNEADKRENAAVKVIKGAGVETARSSALPETVEVVGTVRARTSAVISARIPGSITALKVREGDRVQKGQVLAQLEAQENQANAAMAAAGADEARQGLDEAQSHQKLADITFERYHKLFNEKAISRQEFDVKRTEKELAAQGSARAEARLKQAQERSKAATVMSGYTRIIAPISGIITGKQVDLGATVFPGQPLMTVEDEGSYLLDLAIPEFLAARVKPGSLVHVTLDALNLSFEARISEIVPTADPVSRTFTARTALGQKRLKSGMFGRGSIQLGTTVTGITLPEGAVGQRGAMTFLWVLNKENIAGMRLVKVGKTVGGRIEILSGLSDGERVVVSGIDKITEGTKVE